MNQLPETGFLRLPQIIGNQKTKTPPIIPVSKSVWWHGCRGAICRVGYACHGSMKGTPAASNGEISRVATVKPLASAMAAMQPS